MIEVFKSVMASKTEKSPRGCYVLERTTKREDTVLNYSKREQD